MKRIRGLAAASVLVALVLCACQKEPLPIPDYPLTAETIEAALAEWGVDWMVEELEGTGGRNPDQSWYTLYDAEGDRLLGTISSGRQDGERMMDLFFWSVDVPLEECEKVLLCSARLYGGFDSERTVTDSFLKEYGSVNTTRYEVYTTDRNGKQAILSRVRWSRHIDKVDCQVNLGQSTLEDPQEYITRITFASDWDTFFLLDRF